MPETHAPPRRRRSDFDRNRTRLLAAARRLVAEHGPESLTVSEVAHQAGLNRTTAYQHFRSRDELVGAVLEEMAEARGSSAQSGVDAEMLAHILVGTCLVWALRARTEYDDVPAATARLSREMKRLFLYGLFRPEEMPDLVDSLRPARARKKETP